MFLIAGAREEAVEAAHEALGLARQTADVRCQAYAHLALAEAGLTSPHVAKEHLTRARQLLGTAAGDDLRVAALAYSADRYAKANVESIVRAPLVLEVSTPRALAPGDRSQISVDLHNLSGAASKPSAPIETKVSS